MHPLCSDTAPPTARLALVMAEARDSHLSCFEHARAYAVDTLAIMSMFFSQNFLIPALVHHDRGRGALNAPSNDGRGGIPARWRGHCARRHLRPRTTVELGRSRAKRRATDMAGRSAHSSECHR